MSQPSAYDQTTGLIDTVEKGVVPAMNAVAGAMTGMSSLGAVAADRSLRIPRHILINSAIQDAKRQQDELERRFQTENDMPGIEKEIEDSDRWAKEANARIEALVGRLDEAPPEQDTQTHLTEGEGEALALGLLFGGNAGQAVSGTKANADKRSTLSFQNATRRFDHRQGILGTRLQLAISDKDQAQRWNLGMRDRKMGVKQSMAATRLQTGMAGVDRGLEGRLKEIGLKIDEERRQQDMQHESAMARYKANWDLQMMMLKSQGDDRSEQIQSILKGLGEAQDNPTQPSGIVDQAAASLKALGFNLEPGAIALFKNKAGVNWSRAEVDRKRADLNDAAARSQIYGTKARIGMEAGEKGYTVNPDGSVMPVLPDFGGQIGGFGSNRPMAGPGEGEVQGLGNRIGELDQARADYESVETEYENTIATAMKANGGKLDETMKAGLETAFGAKVRDAKGKLEKVASSVRVARQAVLASISGSKLTPEQAQFKAWLVGQFSGALALVKDVGKGGQETVELPGLAPIDVKAVGPKAAQAAVRKWFRDTTGFDIDDAGLKKLVSGAEVVQPFIPNMTGPIGGGR